MGLGHRYGRRMQTISGIHYNWSLPGVGNDEYFALIRNFRRHAFLLLYLFGASPAVCSSFVAGREHELQTLTPHTLYMPHATSLRMGRLGYQSDAQAIAVGELQQPGGLRRVAARGADQAVPAVRGDRHPQPGRRVQPAGDQPAADRERVLRHDPPQARDQAAASGRCTRCANAASSTSRCAAWTSIRSCHVGITAQTMRFLDIFLLHCLLSDSPPDTPRGDRRAGAQPAQHRRARPRAGAEAGARRREGVARRLGRRAARRLRADRRAARCRVRRQRLPRCAGRRAGGVARAGHAAVGARVVGHPGQRRLRLHGVRAPALGAGAGRVAGAAVVARAAGLVRQRSADSRSTSNAPSRPPTRCRSRPSGRTTCRPSG